MRILFLLLAAFLYHLPGFTQNNVTGNWYGKAEVMASGTHDSYLTELIIKQKGNDVEGIFGYYYRNGYKSFFIRGQYNPKQREVVIKDIPVTYFRSLNIDGVDCMMDLYATLIISKINSTLKGSLVSHKKYSNMCPDLTFYYSLDNNEEPGEFKNAVTRKLWQPQPEEMILTNQVEKEKAEDKSLAIVKENFEKRADIIAKEVDVRSDSLRISFYDNGEIDGDSISVFFNDVPILTKQGLTAEAINIYVKLDPSRPVNEISMYAENLGKYPPNTALLVINDGETRQEVYLSSSLTQNATVRIRRRQ